MANPEIMHFDQVQVDLLRKLATHIAIGHTNLITSNYPLSISTSELAQNALGLATILDKGPTIRRDDLLEVVGILRQIGVDALGVYDDEVSASIYYKPAQKER